MICIVHIGWVISGICSLLALTALAVGADGRSVRILTAGVVIGLALVVVGSES